MKILTIETAGFAGTLNALRLPYGKDVRSHISVVSNHNNIVENTKFLWFQTVDVDIHPDDMKLLSALVKRGDEHAKAIRGLIVYAKITAPVYWWCEMETYRAGHERLSSESTMHVDCKGLSGDDLVRAKSEIPMGKELTKVDAFSYQCLRNIVKQRRNHRLPEWNEFICWIHTVPFAEELIFVGLND